MTSAIFGSYGIGPISNYAAAPPPRVPPGMEAAAKLLGLSDEELRSSVSAGTSLNDLAAKKGVSKNDLVAAIAQDLKANAPAGAPAGIDFAKMAERIADRRPAAGPPPGPPPTASSSAGSSDSPLAALAGELEMSPADLLSLLGSGTSLTDLLNSRGIPAEGLINNLSRGRGFAIDTTA